MIFHRTGTKKRLFCPGPTPVPIKAQLAAIEDYPYHRTEEFYSIFKNCRKILAKFINSSIDPLILSSSGTGAMEAAVVNLTSQGDHVLTVNGGKFGERWAHITRAFGCEAQELVVPWGQGPEPEEISRCLERQPGTKAVFLQANETSTGVAYRIADIAKMIRTEHPEVLIIVDAISALGAEPLDQQAWGLDVVLSGSQKGAGIPPGLSFISLSQRAWDSVTDRPRYYFDLKKELKQQESGKSAFTPAISLVVALQHVLTEYDKAGITEVIRSCQHLGEAVRAGFQAVNLELFARDSFSNALTAVRLPESVDGHKLVRDLRQNYQMTFAGGQDSMSGKLLRMAHFGFADPADLAAGFLALEQELIRLKHPFSPGAGASAFWTRLCSDPLS